MPSLDAFGMVVSDMAATLDFYRLVGLEIPRSADDEQHVDVELAGGVRLMFDTVELTTSIAPWEAPTGGHRIGLAVRCSTPAEVDTTHAALIAAGHRSHLEPFDAFWGQRYATVFDPDGTPVDLYADNPHADERRLRDRMWRHRRRGTGRSGIDCGGRSRLLHPSEGAV